MIFQFSKSYCIYLNLFQKIIKYDCYNPDCAFAITFPFENVIEIIFPPDCQVITSELMLPPYSPRSIFEEAFDSPLPSIDSTFDLDIPLDIFS